MLKLISKGLACVGPAFSIEKAPKYVPEVMVIHEEFKSASENLLLQARSFLKCRIRFCKSGFN